MVRVNPLYAFFISTLYLSYTYFIPPSYPLYTSLLSTLFLLHTYSTFYLLHTHNIPPLYPYPQYTYLLHTYFIPPPLYTLFIPPSYPLCTSFLVNFLKKKCDHDPQFAIQKSKGADSQARRMGENDF